MTKAKGAGLSKVQLAKKMLKKQIVPNTKVTFDEDGDAQGDSHKSKVYYMIRGAIDSRRGK